MVNVLEQAEYKIEEPPRGGFLLSEIDPEEATENRQRAETLRLANGAFTYSHCFWLNHNDLLPNDVAKIVKISQLPNGQMTSEAVEQGQRLQLYFDTRQRRQNTYIWRLKSLDMATRTRTMEQCTINHDQVLSERYNYDFQYRARPSEPSSPHDLFYRILAVAEHDLTHEHIDKLRGELEKARLEIGSFALQAAITPSAKPYWQQDSPQYVSVLDEQRRHLRRATFPDESGVS